MAILAFVVNMFLFFLIEYFSETKEYRGKSKKKEKGAEMVQEQEKLELLTCKQILLIVNIIRYAQCFLTFLIPL